MKATELRIGNWVYQGNTYGNQRVSSYELYGFSGGSNSSYYSEWKPIPLTKEWLERFGFKVGNLYADKGWFWLERYRTLRAYVFVIEDKLIKVKYVHQLQNLYFALTGEELETKPQK